MKKREIVQISTAPDSDGDITVHALCNDGSVWATYTRYTRSGATEGGKKWVMLGSIPQDGGLQNEH